MTAGDMVLPAMAPALKISSDGSVDDSDAVIILMPEATASLNDTALEKWVSGGSIPPFHCAISGADTSSAAPRRGWGFAVPARGCDGADAADAAEEGGQPEAEAFWLLPGTAFPYLPMHLLRMCGY